MKKIYTTLVALFAIVQFSYAQWNASVPGQLTTTGNVGIGTGSPSAYLTVNSSAAALTNAIDLVGYSSSVKGHLGSFSNTTYLTSNYYYNGGQYNDNATYGQAAIALQAGTTNTSAINFLFSDAGAAMPLSKMTILSNGYVGIGTTSPSHKLQVNNTANDRIATFIGGASSSTTLALYVSDSGASVGTDSNTQLGFYANGTTAMTILPSLNVGIGTTSPDAKLAVKGTIHTQELKVDMSGWNDYVFDKDYPLPTLSFVKTYIDKNHHLPEIPSEAEVIKNGVNLGEMVKLQTKKIEELTLYAIEQEKRIATLEAAILKLTANK